MNGTINALLILGALAGLDFVEPRGGTQLFADSGEGGGGGGGATGTGGDAGAGGAGTDTKAGEGSKTFSQADVNGLLARERRAWETKAADAQKAIETKLAEAMQKLEKHEADKALEGATGKDRDILALRQTIAKLEADRKADNEKLSAAEKAREEAIGAFRGHRARGVVKDALLAAGALKGPKALDQATRTFLEEGKAEITVGDDDGLAVAVTFEGKRYDSLAEAVTYWLTQNDHFLATPGGGSGAKNPKGSGGNGSRALADMTVEELARLSAKG